MGEESKVSLRKGGRGALSSRELLLAGDNAVAIHARWQVSIPPLLPDEIVERPPASNTSSVLAHPARKHNSRRQPSRARVQDLPGTLPALVNISVISPTTLTSLDVSPLSFLLAFV